jgi:uncharacterized protein (TIGR02391 family)
MKPVSILELKKAFLKVLYENMVEKKVIFPVFLTKLASKKLLPGIVFSVNPKTIQQVTSELVRDGYIKPYKTNSYMLTKKGLGQTAKPFEKMELPTMDLVSLISSNFKLFRATHNDYIEGDFEIVVFKSFKLLEESVREKAQLTANDYGKDLMIKAFRPITGRLVCQSAETNAEQDSLLDLMKGAIGFYKNPKSHRTVVIENPDKVIRIVLLARLLLDVLDDCVFRPPAQATT